MLKFDLALSTFVYSISKMELVIQLPIQLQRDHAPWFNTDVLGYPNIFDFPYPNNYRATHTTCTTLDKFVLIFIKPQPTFFDQYSTPHTGQYFIVYGMLYVVFKASTQLRTL